MIEDDDGHTSISAIVRELGARDSVSVGEIVDRFGTRAFGALLFIWSVLAVRREVVTPGPVQRQRDEIAHRTPAE